MEREVTLTEMLDAREHRAMRQQELLAAYSRVLVSFTMNIAGPIKKNENIAYGYRVGKMRLDESFLIEGISVVHFEEILSHTGDEAIYVVEGSPEVIKRITVEIEDRDAIGRLFDMDVIRINGKKVEREELGLPGRHCLICERPAKECARSRTHSVDELQKCTREILVKDEINDIAEKGSELACRALLYEVCTTPKPGLVDRMNNGSHKDMDIFTFINSTCALKSYFASCIRTGRETRKQSEKETFKKIRILGKRAEKTMFSATGGVNTHKGAIFSMGIICGALGRLERESLYDPEAILAVCAGMTEGIIEEDFGEVTADNAVTNGQNIYLSHGIKGVRGQAEAGFPAVLKVGLPVLEQGIAEGRNINDAGCAALLALMTAETDTNLIARSSIKVQKETVAAVTALLEHEPYPKEKTLRELDALFIEKNLSPGGSADLLAICYFLHFIKEEFLCHNI